MEFNFARTTAVLGISMASLFPVASKADVHTFDFLNNGYGFHATGTFTTDASDQLQVMFPAIPAVPEPSTWAMMILGFVGIAVVAYRRRSSGTLLRLA